VPISSPHQFQYCKNYFWY